MSMLPPPLTICLFCRREKSAEEHDRDMCRECEDAVDYVHQSVLMGPCPVCHTDGPLWTTDYRSADFRYCLRHAITETLYQRHYNTCDHAGDVRPVSAYH